MTGFMCSDLLCPDGRYGQNCAFLCPTVQGAICAGHGTCDNKIYSDGQCVCHTGYAGQECTEECPGGAANPCGGHGQCSAVSGMCACDEGYATQNCSVRCPGLGMGVSACYGHGACQVCVACPASSLPQPYLVLCCVVLCCVALRCVALRCVVLCCVVLCCAVLCCVVLCPVVLCCVVLCCVVLCCVVLCCVVLCCVALCCVVLCCVALRCVALRCVVLCCVVLCCVVLCCVVLCCVALRCVVLCCAEGAVTRRQWPGCLPTGTSKREGCVSSARAVCKCVINGGKRGGGETWMSRSRRLLSFQKIPAVLPLSPPAGAGAAPATPTPSCCSGPGGPRRHLLVFSLWHQKPP